MEKHDIGMYPFYQPSIESLANLSSRIVLNIHGEVLEALAPEGLSLEEAFLPTLKTLHEQFPNLRIIVRLPGL